MPLYRPLAVGMAILGSSHVGVRVVKRGELLCYIWMFKLGGQRKGGNPFFAFHPLLGIKELTRRV